MAGEEVHVAANRPTVYDVAEKAGVSIATVSFTFRRPEKVKDSTRDLVEAAAKELGYIPSASARGLAGGRTGVLGMLSLDHRPLDLDSAESPPDNSNSDFRLFPLYVDEVQRGVEQESWRRGYSVMVAGAHSSNSEAVLRDIAGRVDGLAVFSGTVDDAELRRIAERLPVLVLSETRLDSKFPRISVDNTGGIRAVVEHLVGTHGIQDLAFVGPIHDSDRNERFTAFQEALRAAELPVPEEPLAASGDHRAMAQDLIARNALPGAFVCGTDEVALDVLDTLQGLGVQVPGQVAVTGFDGIVAGRLSSPPLTSVRQPMAAMGAAVVQVLIDRIERPGEPARSRVFPVQLAVRQSCGCSQG
jgi:LacI family transcriptional regulator